MGSNAISYPRECRCPDQIGEYLVADLGTSPRQDGGPSAGSGVSVVPEDIGQQRAHRIGGEVCE
jgi:hypothetical protein